MKRRSELYLRDALSAIDTVQRAVTGKSLEFFKNNASLQYTVLWNLQIVDEAASNVSAEFKERHADVPGRDIQDLRVVIVHRYWKIYLDEIWDIVQNKLEPLHKQSAQILAEEQQAA